MSIGAVGPLCLRRLSFYLEMIGEFAGECIISQRLIFFNYENWEKYRFREKLSFFTP